MILSRGTIFSLIAHASIILFMVVKVSFFSKPRLDLSEAIRVDMVGLPEKYNPAQKSNDLPEKIEQAAKPVAEEKKPEPVAEAKPEPKAEPKEVKPDPKAKPEAESIKLDKTKEKQKAALEKLKKMSAVDKIRQQVQNEKTAAETAKILKGRIISKGTALTGLDRIQSDNYTGQLDALVKSHWALPQWLIGKSLKTRVLVKIEPDGRVSDKKVVQSSGNPTYDDYCLQAVTKASPFPKVPEKFTEVYAEDGVVFGFPE